MKVGIWCDYGFTLAPSEGIGVFVSNLVRGLATVPQIEQCLMVANSRDSDVLDELAQAYPNFVKVVINSHSTGLKRRGLKAAARLRRFLYPPQSAKAGVTANWLMSLEARLAGAQQPFLSQPDVWLIPYVGFEMVIQKPTVVVVHDLVNYHFPEGSNLRRLNHFKRLVTEVVGRASLVACMSEFILQNDLLKTLRLPQSKTRMVRYAVPMDMGFSSQSSAKIEQSLGEENMIFYPSAFRMYKNHALLIRSLGELTRRGKDNWQVVFTGIRECPRSLRDLSHSLGVSSRVHTLGKVSRESLKFLYQRAFVTAVPSLYEQGSFPLYEALYCGCPIMASRIPSLTEQFHDMHDCVPFFDPQDESEFVDRLLDLEMTRDQLLRKQLAGFEKISSYTWYHAAREWTQVFQDAINAV